MRLPSSPSSDVAARALGPKFASAISLIDEQARRQPVAIAAECAGESLTYQDLDVRSNGIAAGLRNLGVGPETIVGVAAEPGFEMIAGILGILKAGGAYLPLDPTLPRKRLGFMLADSGARLTITTDQAFESLRQAATATSAEVRTIADTASTPSSDERASLTAIAPEQLAYVIYTSGSSGQPKGVLLEHAGLASMARCHARTFHVGPGSRVLQFGSLSFDASVHEMFMTLAAGGTLCLAPREQLLPGGELAHALKELKITNVLLPPTALAAMPPIDLPQLKTLISGGERRPASEVRRWAPGREFFNAYGPTETTVTATLWQCSPDEVADPPIGTAVDGATLHILDESGLPVSDEVSGELYVSGVGVARGYLNRPELTAEKFLELPDEAGACVRAFRTGDIVHRRADGALRFVDRVDRQVKVRGYRIELGEIESRLVLHPALSQAAVVVAESGESAGRLVAFCVCRSGETIDVPRVRAWLAEALPQYMAPGLIFFPGVLPMSAAGKIDYVALAARAHEAMKSATELQSDSAVPTDDATAALRTIWKRALGLEELTADEHFIEIGGDSLVAAQIAEQAETIGLRFTAGELLAHPTIAKLEALLAAKPQTGAPREF